MRGGGGEELAIWALVISGSGGLDKLSACLGDVLRGDCRLDLGLPLVMDSSRTPVGCLSWVCAYADLRIQVSVTLMSQDNA